MSKEKKTFFERLTGSIPENADYENGSNYDLSSIGSEEKTYEEEDGQLAVDVFQGKNEVIIQFTIFIIAVRIAVAVIIQSILAACFCILKIGRQA